MKSVVPLIQHGISGKWIRSPSALCLDNERNRLAVWLAAERRRRGGRRRRGVHLGASSDHRTAVGRAVADLGRRAKGASHRSLQLVGDSLRLAWPQRELECVHPRIVFRKRGVAHRHDLDAGALGRQRLVQGELQRAIAVVLHARRVREDVAYLGSGRGRLRDLHVLQILGRCGVTAVRPHCGRK